jgi:antitoxin component of MazEF toxin-antitoxin module
MSAASRQEAAVRFQTTIQQDGNNTGIEIPEEIVLGLGAGKRPPVVLTVNGYAYRNTVAVMGGAYMVGLSAAHREASGLAGGDAVEVDVELDTAPRTVEVPPDLAAALDADPAARATFEGLSNSNKGWHVSQVTGAKTDDTRQRRIARSVAALSAGRQR